MSKSYPEDLKSYLCTRLITVPMLLLLIVLLLATWFPSMPIFSLTTIMQIWLAVILVAMFRLWDDLSDVPADRIKHPNRVLSFTTHENLFRRTCMSLGIAAFTTLLLSNPISIVGFGLLTAAFAVYYKLPWRKSWPRAGYHVLLLKYPCLIVLISMSAVVSIDEQRVILMLLTYVALCVYEVAHDPALRSDSHCRCIAAVEFIAASVLATYIAITTS
ncbi:hypothetical protein N9276_00990 [Rhodopirellula sp.]|nr:hypothetical protein [Rhodopirellula sp.]